MLLKMNVATGAAGIFNSRDGHQHPRSFEWFSRRLWARMSDLETPKINGRGQHGDIPKIVSGWRSIFTVPVPHVHLFISPSYPEDTMS
jgi:hypothetical protein